jgi:hypothetical protein
MGIWDSVMELIIDVTAMVFMVGALWVVALIFI